MIEIKNFSKSYSDVTVFENFNLTLEEGKITCILGESGSGKTTLLNAVAHLTEYGGNITGLKSSYVFQTPRLCSNVSDCRIKQKAIPSVFREGRLKEFRSPALFSLRAT